MGIHGVGSSYIANATLASVKHEAGKDVSLTQSTEVNVRGDKQAQESSTVTLSGRAIMASRLFSSESGEPPVLPNIRTNGEYMGMLPQHFLTESDRSLISEMYELAYEEGVDLRYVDQLAKDLGRYRKYDDGSMRGSFNESSYDLQGRKQTVSFTEKDATTAERILSGSALSSTRLDQGFIRWRLDPGQGFNLSSNHDFLEQMVTQFSSGGNEVAELGSKFSSYVRLENNYILHTADEVTLHRPSVSEASTEEDQFKEALASFQTTKQDLNERLLEGFFGKSEARKTEQSLLSRLFDLLKISNTSKRG
ncbi:hypothetical protein [Vreelandella hamiltonii]|uniref:Uncharacterized protein n=2 Tax=Halomonadaceae TaxID=28256 RepID=A0A8H9I5H3_9GAMM|nr:MULTISPECIES: hypothetical protein [Halomonas]GGW42337.1 hypothetical protein GCM10007157_35740 [Halomonas hamiltonii]GGW71745.1 hypothetical protein GCM10007158_35120 [Halomonas johnsoniae]